MVSNLHPSPPSPPSMLLNMLLSKIKLQKLLVPWSLARERMLLLSLGQLRDQRLTLRFKQGAQAPKPSAAAASGSSRSQLPAALDMQQAGEGRAPLSASFQDLGKPSGSFEEMRSTTLPGSRGGSSRPGSYDSEAGASNAMAAGQSDLISRPY